MDAVLARIDPNGAMTDAWTRPVRARPSDLLGVIVPAIRYSRRASAFFRTN